MADEILIRAEHLSRRYGAHRAVADLSFELGRGDVLGLLGPNGAGKSTTMQMLTGNLAPDAGRIVIAGVDLLDHPREAKRRLGYLPEQPPLYRELTVDEYLGYCARLHGLRGAAAARAGRTAAARCGVADVGHRLIGNLSKGYRQRVGIAQAVLHNPAVVVLDEPTVGLDPLQIREIRALIAELGREHGIVLSTHILPEVQAVCNRVLIIHEGRLVYTDTAGGLADRLQARSLVLDLRHPPAEVELAAVDGVSDVQTLDDGRLRIHFDGASPAEALAERAAAGGWGLRELTPERRTLEQVFVELTCSEPGATEAAP